MCVADAGTDCALGEVFNIEVPPGLEAAQLEVYAKHSLTGDDHIGTATISLEAVKVRGPHLLVCDTRLAPQLPVGRATVHNAVCVSHVRCSCFVGLLSAGSHTGSPFFPISVLASPRVCVKVLKLPHCF